MTNNGKVYAYTKVYGKVYAKVYGKVYGKMYEYSKVTNVYTLNPLGLDARSLVWNGWSGGEPQVSPR